MSYLKYPLILASQSPRRQELLQQTGFEFSVIVKPTSETYPDTLDPYHVPAYLAEQKAEEFETEQKNNLVLCADTIVLLNGKILNKPENENHARQMLESLSGHEHEVLTAVCLAGPEGTDTRTDAAKVIFRKLEKSEIDYYIAQYKPFDKAGAYGIQEWIGMTGITRIEGSFYTIMGLPTHLVFDMLKPYIH